VRYPIGTPGFWTRQITRVTTLVAAEVYPVADLAARYRQRWQVETSLAHRKTTMPMDVRHGQTVSGVLNALTVCAIVSNLVRLVMGPSAMRQRIGVERISCLAALRWLGGPNTGLP
jgi:IS4 transposase